jgi:DNA-binding beta-propeller fold protein YncE
LHHDRQACIQCDHDCCGADAVYVTEPFAGQVSKIETNGAKTVVAKDKMPEGIALAPDGNLIVAEAGARRIVQIDPNRGTVTEIAANLPIGLPAARADCRPTFRPASARRR